jgi:hypothetical protein
MWLCAACVLCAIARRMLSCDCSSFRFDFSRGGRERQNIRSRRGRISRTYLKIV